MKYNNTSQGRNEIKTLTTEYTDILKAAKAYTLIL